VRRTTLLSMATMALLLGACATSTGPGAKSYGLSDLNAYEAVGRGEGREALAYYEARGTQREGGGALAKAEAARAYGAAAAVAQYLGLYQKAIRHGRKAVTLLEALPEYQAVLEGRITLCNLLGFTQAQIGDLDEARGQFETCLDLANRFTDVMLSLSSSATVWMGLSSVAFLQGDYLKASDLGKRSIELREDFLDRLEGTRQWNRRYSEVRERNTIGYALALLILGRSEWELRRLDAAEGSYRRAFEAARSVGARQFEVVARAGLAEVASARGDAARGEREARAAVAESTRLGLSFFSTLILSRVGNHAAERGRHEDALRLFQQAMRTVEDARSQLEESALRGFFLEDKQVIYHGAVRSALSLGRAEEAFDFAERGRARAFLDILGTHTALAKGRTSALLPEEERVRARLSDARAAAQVAQAPEASASVRSGGTPVRDIAIGEYQAFVDRVRKENLEQASLMTVEPVTVREVQALLPEGTTLLEYLVTEQETVVWVVDRSGVEAVRLAAPRSALVTEVRALRNAIAELTSIEAVQRHAGALYERLVAPVRPHIRYDRLLIVPHDVLHYLPFAALRTPEGRWLVEGYTLATLPSASVLKYLAGKGKGRGDRPLIVGNPDVGPGLALPWAEREARVIGELYPSATVLVRRDATEAAAKALSGAAGLLHFATHGELRERDPLSSALLLTPDGQEDGRLEVREIFRLDLNARLVVLSACETGLGKLSKGDELVGLQRAFLYAGTPAVITSLWKVEDRATYELMREFHGQLKARGAAEALRHAQRATMKEFPHPFFWAAFGLTGTPQ